MLPKAAYLSCVVLVYFFALSEAQRNEAIAASLSKAPVGLYSRVNAFGDVENAASISGAPVGLYSKRHGLQYPLPILRYPLYYPAVLPVPGYGKIYHVKRPVGPYRPPVPRPPGKPGVQPRLWGGGGLLGGGLLGGGLGGGGGLLGGLLGGLI